VVLSLEGPPAALLEAEAAHAASVGAGGEGETRAQWRLFAALLQAQFGGAVLDEEAATIALGGPLDGAAGPEEAEAVAERGEAPLLVMLRTGEVVCPTDPGRRARVEKALERFGQAIQPILLPPMAEDALA